MTKCVPTDVFQISSSTTQHPVYLSPLGNHWSFFLIFITDGESLTALFISLGTDRKAVFDNDCPNARREGHSGQVLSKIKR